METPKQLSHHRTGQDGQGQDALDLDIRALALRLLRYKWLVLGLVTLVVSCTWFYSLQLRPLYTATAMIMIEPPESHVVDIEAVVSGVSADPESVHGEVIVLQSRELSEKAVEHLDLFETWRPKADASEQSTLSRLNPFTALSTTWNKTLDSLSGNPPRVPLSEAEREELYRATTVNRFRSALSLQSQTGSRVVDVSFTFGDPRLAAMAANALAEVYVRHTLDVKFEGTQEANSWLNERLAELRLTVEESEAAVDRLRNGQALIEGRSAQVVNDQIAALNSQLIEARSEAARLRNRLQHIESLQGNFEAITTSSQILNSLMVQTLRQELFGLERDAAELSTEYGDKHPRMINIRAEIQSVQARIKGEVGKIIAGLRNDLNASQTHVSELKGSLDRLTNEVGSLNQAESELRSLEREAEANRLLFQTFLVRYKETTVQEKLQQPDARIISRAQPPTHSSYPNRKAILFGAFVAALAMSLGLVAFLELADKSFRAAQQLETQTGFPVLGTIPGVDKRQTNGDSLIDFLLANPNSQYSEAVRLLHANICWSQATGKKARTVLLTSSLPAEGKTTIALSIARRAAYLGQKSLIIDCDLRHPAASKALGLEVAPGLADVLAGKVSLDDVLQLDEDSQARFIGTGALEYDPVSLLQSKAMAKFMDEVRQRFDIIVLDSSPVLAVTEPRILARLADHTLFIVRWGKTPRAVVKEGLKQLHEFGVTIDGLVMSQVDLRQQASYGYGEYGYYANKMGSYYSTGPAQ